MPPAAPPFDLDYLLDLLLYFDFLDCNTELWLIHTVLVVCCGADVLVEMVLCWWCCCDGYWWMTRRRPDGVADATPA
jgi:hypothetical protein